MNSLDTLKASGIARLDWRDLLTLTGELTDEETAAMDKYFSRFVKSDKGKCISCELVQGGLISALLGGFRWGLAHGEGRCSRCGWPGRALHYDVGPIKRLEIILQYHPDEVHRKDESEAE